MGWYVDYLQSELTDSDRTYGGWWAVLVGLIPHCDHADWLPMCSADRVACGRQIFVHITRVFRSELEPGHPDDDSVPPVSAPAAAAVRESARSASSSGGFAANWPNG